jgi:peptidoglycan/xylan/chitin deacetylase (PgdA/CDA1 family)
MKHNALVLHKISNSNLNNFEDVSTDNLIFILEKTLNKTITTIDLLKSINNSFIITFDDGFKSDYTQVLALLKRYNAKAIFFIVINYVGRKDYLTWEQIQELSDADMEIGSHSMSHPNFKLLSRNEKIEELELSKRIIETKIGKKIHSFSIPFGFTDKELEKLVFECGYSYCFTSKHGLFNNSQHTIPRNSINSKMNLFKIYNALYPGILVIISWYFEDIFKQMIKKFLGKSYYFIRKKLLH